MYGFSFQSQCLTARGHSPSDPVIQSREERLRDGRQKCVTEKKTLSLPAALIAPSSAPRAANQFGNVTVFVVPLHTRAHGGVEVLCVRAGLYILTGAGGGCSAAITPVEGM